MSKVLVIFYFVLICRFEQDFHSGSRWKFKIKFAFNRCCLQRLLTYNSRNMYPTKTQCATHSQPNSARAHTHKHTRLLRPSASRLLPNGARVDELRVVLRHRLDQALGLQLPDGRPRQAAVDLRSPPHTPEHFKPGDASRHSLQSRQVSSNVLWVRQDVLLPRVHVTSTCPTPCANA